mmetsp:Transcript_2179/g.6464  ORF Transcript_2179/g.6464 Transcript_2179/m.6464 type:complete len:283 (-) Transcript_2179:2075-2923(-)
MGDSPLRPAMAISRGLGTCGCASSSRQAVPELWLAPACKELCGASASLGLCMGRASAGRPAGRWPAPTGCSIGRILQPGSRPPGVEAVPEAEAALLPELCRSGGVFARTSTQSMKGAFSRLLSNLASPAGTRTTRSFSQDRGKLTETPFRDAASMSALSCWRPLTSAAPRWSSGTVLSTVLASQRASTKSSVAPKVVCRCRVRGDEARELLLAVSDISVLLLPRSSWRGDRVRAGGPAASRDPWASTSAATTMSSRLTGPRSEEEDVAEACSSSCSSILSLR